MVNLRYKLYVIVVFCLFYLSPVSADENGDLDSTLEQTAEFDDESTDELSLDSDEIRANYLYSVSIGAGMAEAWQEYHLSGVFFNESGWNLYASLGGAKLHYSGKRVSKDYEINIVARSFGVGVRYYFEQFPALFFQGSSGLGLFTGDISPEGEDGAGTEQSDLRSGVSATGFWLSQQLGWQAVWESGYHIEISLVGAEKTWLISKAFTRNSGEARTTLTEKIEAPYSWGILNLKLGLMF